jgi:hypothetical protein
MGFEPMVRCDPYTGLANRLTDAPSPNGVKGCDDAENDLAFCLALLGERMPDLAVVIGAWSKLPEVVRAGIAAMVEASKLPR